MISFWISVVPPKIDWTRLSAQVCPVHCMLAHLAVAAVHLDEAVGGPAAKLGVPPLDHGGLLFGEPTGAPGSPRSVNSRATAISEAISPG
jgi:hypothetical protein